MILEVKNSYRDEFEEVIMDHGLEDVYTTDSDLGENLYELLDAGMKIMAQEGFSVEKKPRMEYSDQLEVNGMYHRNLYGRDTIQLGAGTFPTLAVEVVTHEIGHGLDYWNAAGSMDTDRSEAFWRSWDLYFWDVPRGGRRSQNVPGLLRKRDEEERLQGEQDSGNVRELQGGDPGNQREIYMGRPHTADGLGNELKTVMSVN